MKHSSAWNSPSTSHMSGNITTNYSCSTVYAHNTQYDGLVSTNTWIIDTGATNHITCHLAIMTNVTRL